MKGRGIAFSVRGKSPCAGCTEKFIGCHGRCPKDLRGEEGYNTWTANCEPIKEKRRQYTDNMSKYKWRGE